jgi:NADH:ubiquinone oxidoreductase subunit C
MLKAEADGATTNEAVKKVLEEALGSKIRELVTPRARRMFVLIESKDLLEACHLIREGLGITHLSTVTGLDTGERLEILYHFAAKDLVLTVKVAAGRDHPHLSTILGIYPAAVFYEREVHDLLGVHFDGHPDLRPLVLPEAWPEGVYPLRKDWKYDREGGMIQ